MIAWRRGTYRRVLLIGPFAVKFPRLRRFTDGAWCNREESRLYRETSHEILCPVLHIGPFGFWLVMPRALPMPDLSMSEKIPHVEMMLRFQRETGQELGDVKGTNAGMLSGRFVMIDYAGFPPRARTEFV